MSHSNHANEPPSEPRWNWDGTPAMLSPGAPPSECLDRQRGYTGDRGSAPPWADASHRGRENPSHFYVAIPTPPGLHPSIPRQPPSPQNPINGYRPPARGVPGPPSPAEIDYLQCKIRSLFINDSESPGHNREFPSRPPPPANRKLYYSPPLRRTNPSYPPPRQIRSQGTDAPPSSGTWDSCEDITMYALSIVRGLEIPEDERLEKEAFCRELERIVKQIRPSAKVELFGSFANTFTIANSDIDCCVTDAEATSNELQSSGLPEKLQDHLNALGGYETTLVTQTRIPILKVFRPATSSLIPDSTSAVYKYPLHCDVGWQNRLALHNTRLLRAYSALDPRLREISLFIKYWTKTRVISRPRYGTLCSYGYVLMIIFFLTNVVRPAVLPNLQCLPRQGRVRIEDIECEGCNISFSDGMGWKSDNKQSIGELIKDFFNYFAFEWHFKNNVISIRSPSGIITKESKGWTTLAESTGSHSQTIKSRYLIAIEDPFEITHNVARTVNKQGRLDIRGEFARAAKMLNSERMRRQFLGDVCVERVLPPRPLSMGEREVKEKIVGTEREEG